MTPKNPTKEVGKHRAKLIGKPSRKRAVALDISRSTSLRIVDSSVPAPTLDEITASFKDEAVILGKFPLIRFGRQLFNRWLGQAERVWIAKNAHGVAVRAFAKMVEINDRIAFDLVKLWDDRDPIIHVAETEGRYYYWRDMLGAYLGRTPRERNLIGEQRQQIEELTERLRKSEARSKKFAGYQGMMGTPSDGVVETPPYFFDFLNAIHNFDFDVCANKDNTKVADRYFDIETDALKQEWRFKTGWMNPPFKTESVEAFLKKAIEELRLGHCEKVVALLPTWNEKGWFDLAYHGHIQFLKGYLRFENMDGNAPWPLIVVTLTKNPVGSADDISASRLIVPRPKPQNRRRTKAPKMESES
jgi:hypothetical protein